MHRQFYNRGFTLAETLIVIGVIGIVSALTLPNLNSSTGDKEKVAKVQKIYQNLSDAFGRAEAVYGPYDEWFVNIGNTDLQAKAKRAGERLSEFMKISKMCETSTGGSCVTNKKIKSLVGEEMDVLNNSTSYYKFITADGASIMVRGGGVTVDIDGPSKGFFTYGKDVFDFTVYSEGIFPSAYFVPFNDESFIRGIRTKDTAASWIIRYGNADYLQFTDNAGTCKNGNVVTETNPTCK